jgi:hypothetical protein
MMSVCNRYSIREGIKPGTLSGHLQSRLESVTVFSTRKTRNNGTGGIFNTKFFNKNFRVFRNFRVVRVRISVLRDFADDAGTLVYSLDISAASFDNERRKSHSNQ